VSRVRQSGRIGLICSGSVSVTPAAPNPHIVIPNPALSGEAAACGALLNATATQDKIETLTLAQISEHKWLQNRAETGVLPVGQGAQLPDAVGSLEADIT
jgi:hypothetical protein